MDDLFPLNAAYNFVHLSFFAVDNYHIEISLGYQGSNAQIQNELPYM